jgi:hypothetical protein
MKVMNYKLTDSKQTGIIAVSLLIVLMGIAAWFMGYTGRQETQVTAPGTTSQEPAATQY